MLGDLGGETDGAIVLGCVAEDLAGIDDAPEGVVVARDAVEDLAGDPGAGRRTSRKVGRTRPAMVPEAPVRTTFLRLGIGSLSLNSFLS